MMDNAPFADHYAALQVYRDCSVKGLEAAYRYLAKMFHPDHPETADVDKFNEVIEAYRVLRNPEQRAEYDLQYELQHPSDASGDTSHSGDAAEQSSALSDADAHSKILLFLYQRRREQAQNPGIIGFYIQEMLKCSDESFEFHAWYLKAKGFIETTEQGTLAITIAGVDHVISVSQTSRAEKLLIGQSSSSRT